MSVCCMKYTHTYAGAKKCLCVPMITAIMQADDNHHCSPQEIRRRSRSSYTSDRQTDRRTDGWTSDLLSLSSRSSLFRLLSSIFPLLLSHGRRSDVAGTQR